MSRFVLDTNVLLRLAEPGHEQRPQAREAIDALVDAGHTPHLVPQVLHEFWVVATRTKEANGLNIETAEAVSLVDEFADQMPILFDDAAVFAKWRELSKTYAVRGVPNHDLRIVAAMAAHGVETLLTFNRKHFAKFVEIEVVEPSEVETWVGSHP